MAQTFLDATKWILTYHLHVCKFTFSHGILLQMAFHISAWCSIQYFAKDYPKFKIILLTVDQFAKLYTQKMAIAFWTTSIFPTQRVAAVHFTYLRHLLSDSTKFTNHFLLWAKFNDGWWYLEQLSDDYKALFYH